MITQMNLDEERWTNAVHNGARWLFWVALISAVLVNAIGFALPFIGGTRRHLMWVAIIPAFAGLGIAYAVFSITTREPGSTPIWSGRRTTLRIIAGFHALANLGAPISMALANPANTNYFLVGMNFLRIGLSCAFFLYIGSLARRFGLGKLARIAGTLAWLFPTASLAMPLGSQVFGAAMEPNHLLFLFCDLTLNLSVGIWTLHCIWRFGSNITLAARGRCLRCGYRLTGQTESRCSECSTPFSWGWHLLDPGDPYKNSSKGVMETV